MNRRLVCALTLLIFLFRCLPVQCGQPDNYNMLIDFNAQFNFYYFEQLRSYIINNGDRKTYCPNYKDNPHYVFDDLSLEIYLNPTNRDGRIPSDNDYNVMYLLEDTDPYPIHYYLYLTSNRDVVLYDYDGQLVDSYKRQKSVEHLATLIQKILLKTNIFQ